MRSSQQGGDPVPIADAAVHTKSRLTYVCGQCGGPNIRCDAWAQWSEEAQCWELAQTFSQTFCDDCGGETSAEEQPQDDAQAILMSNALGAQA